MGERLSVILGSDTVHIEGKSNVAKGCQLLGTLLHEVSQPPEAVDNKDTWTFSLNSIVVCQIAFQRGAAVAIRNRLRMQSSLSGLLVLKI